MKVLCLIFTVLALCYHADGLKVLGILPLGATSHYNIGTGILKSLHKAGHEITVISPYPLKKPLENFHDISTKKEMKEYQGKNPMKAFEINKIPSFFMFFFLYKLGNEVVEVSLKSDEVKNFLKSSEKFDVCVIEIFGVDALLGIAEQVDCVVISYTTFGAVKWSNDMTSNQMPASYVPQPFLRFTDKMNFVQRFENTLITLVEDLAYPFHLMNQRRLYKKYFPNAKKSFDEMYKSSAIIFINNHVSSSSARPYLPNMIEIGGVHVEPAKPLPKDLQEFLDSAKNGVILFSMGSNIQAVDWPEEKREALVKVFGKLKQKVLWKYENETLPNKPDNVMISPWIPQRDILAHPNIKLFITHGGLLGTTEGLVEGVPVLGIPVFGDQKMNMAKAVERGYGQQVNLDDLNEETLKQALNEVLNNPKYAKNAKEISNRFTDRPMTPQETVVYWTEYAFRHKGAPHLKAAGNDLGFIEFYLIDVYASLALLGSLILFIDYLILKIILKKIFKKQTSDKKLKKK